MKTILGTALSLMVVFTVLGAADVSAGADLKTVTFYVA